MTAKPQDDRPKPEDCAREGCDGTPVTLSDGRAWLLADGGLLNHLDAIRDRIDDSARLTEQVEMGDVNEAAFSLLLANYELAPSELVGLLAGAEAEVLVPAVMEALFGPEQSRRTYTTWAASALIANGIDPSSVPTPLRAHVLEQLVATGRAIPAGKYIESAAAARKRALFRSLAAKHAQPREETTGPPTLISGPPPAPETPTP
ncbi:hypothetical protein P12x_003046 [Tundrisphaera lichenicola]|uniref:hypothetical protein n=1 Tax=Tundrisphaera lichenicola TaxID=2029860 RepID=UPI003EBF2C1E